MSQSKSPSSFNITPMQMVQNVASTYVYVPSLPFVHWGCI